VKSLPSGFWTLSAARIAGCWKELLLAGLAVAGLALLYARDPAVSSIYPCCPFRALTGLCCPGCGSLRCLHQMLHGNLLDALRLNPLTVLALPVLIYCFLGDLLSRASPCRLPRMRVGAAWIWLLLAVILAFWILRNIPCYPFSLLAA
jgi:hypothetical protein